MSKKKEIRKFKKENEEKAQQKYIKKVKSFICFVIKRRKKVS